jgi:hypothetical protein
MSSFLCHGEQLRRTCGGSEADVRPDPNLQVIAHLVAGRPAAAAETLRGTANPAAFAAFVDQQGLRFYLADWIELGGLGPVLPGAWAARLVKAARGQRVRQDRLVAELMRLGDAFDAAGIDCTLLKGAYLADRFYGGIGRRGFLDIDLLVRAVDLVRATRALAALGYAPKSRLVFGVRVMARFAHAFDYVTTIDGAHGAEPVTVDLHGSLSVHPSFRVDYERLWRQRSVWVLAGRPFRVLGDEDEIVSGVLAVLRDGERGAARLKLFLDVFRVLQATDARIDWDRFFARRAAEGLLRPSVEVLELLFELLDCRPCFPALAAALQARRPRPARAAGARDWILRPTAFPVRHKVWSACLYECSPAVSLAWWSASLPFRLMVFQRGRLRRRIRAWFRYHRPKKAG